MLSFQSFLSDPGHTRLKFALRIICTIAVSCSAMFLLADRSSGLGFLPVMFAGLVGLQANVIIQDATAAAKKITLILFALSSAVYVTVSVALQHIGCHLTDVMLLPAAFAVFYAQRYGSRANSVGLIGFLTYYFSVMYMTEIRLSQLPWFYEAILMSSVTAYIFLFGFARHKTRSKETEHSAVHMTELPAADPYIRKGMQAVAASIAALFVGHAVSPSFPYWTVLVANMVLLGTGRARQTLTKAKERAAGTIIGVLVGFLLGYFVHGHFYVSMALLAVFIFTAYYSLHVSYAVFSFWLTLVLTSAFSLLDVGSIGQILSLRLLDTLIGTVIGILASAYVLPLRARADEAA